MFIDLHIHSCASVDCAMRPADIIKRAKEKGLDRICITDHNRIDGALAAQKLDPDFVIVGEEIRTRSGNELLAFFVTEWVPPGLSPQETIARLKDQKAIISVSHPFDRYRHPWDETQLASLRPAIDAIEGFNARSLHRKDTQKANAFAVAHNLPVTAGSDSHFLMEIGSTCLDMPWFRTAEELKKSLTSARIRGKRGPSLLQFLSPINFIRAKCGLKPSL